MKYKWLLFDADGTLFNYDTAEQIALKKSAEEIGLTYDENLLRAYKKFNGDMWLLFEKGEIKPDELKVKRFSLLLDYYNYDYDCVKLSSIYIENLADCSVLIDGAENIVKQLSKTSKLMLITNGLQSVQRKRFNNSSIKNYFQDIIISEEIGYAKPDPKMLEYAKSKMDSADKNQMMIIGDSLSSDIKAGNNFGIDTCWYNPTRKINDQEVDITFEINDLKELLDITNN
jgi:YjjG family noncanonical pyrimidine nucleotidase